jgi:hypothetical protein
MIEKGNINLGNLFCVIEYTCENFFIRLIKTSFEVLKFGFRSLAD